MKKEREHAMREQISFIKTSNPHLNFEEFEIDGHISVDDRVPFKALGIINLLSL